MALACMVAAAFGVANAQDVKWHDVSAFEIEGRRIRIVVPMPQREQFAATPAGRRRVASSESRPSATR